MTKEELDKFIIENQKIVPYTLWKHFRHYMLLENGKYQDDILQEGMLNLIIAAKNYDSSKAKFSTYAIQYIWGRLHRYFGSKRVRDDFGDNLIYSLNVYANNCSTDKDIEFINNLVDLKEDFKNIELDDVIQNSKIEDIQTIVHYLAEGYSQVEIGCLIGKTQGHVSNKISQLRKEINYNYLIS